MLVEYVFWGGLGLILGSFTNVLILRHGEKTLMGRSECPNCTTTLHPYELIPVVSYLALRGKCRTCGKRISLQYPVVEILTALLTLTIGLTSTPLAARLVGAGIAVLLVAIAVYDLRHTVIPDAWSYSLAGLALIFGSLTLSFANTSEILVYLGAGPLLALPLAALWYFSDGKWMGLGDAKFALAIGWLLGVAYGYVALALAFCIGAFVGVFILLPSRYVRELAARRGITRFQEGREGFTMQSEVPFGPFLILGLCIVWISALYNLALVETLARFLSLS